MVSPKIRISGPGLAAALGAGLASALFSMLIMQKSSFALAMSLIAPLPIMIASLGFGSLAGLIAVLVGAAAVGFFDMRPEGLVFVLPSRLTSSGIDVLSFAVSLGLPSWLLTQLAITPIVVPQSGPQQTDSERLRRDERLLGRLVAVAAGFAAVGVALDFAVAITRLGGFAPFMASTISKAEPIVQSVVVANRSLPKGISAHEIARVVTWGQMPLMSAGQLVLLVFNLWLAARIAQASSLLSVAWPDIPRFLRVPRILALVLAIALGLSFAGGLFGMMALIVSGALLMSFALQGLAVIHAVTRGKSFRLPLLIIVYLTMVLLMPWLLILHGLFGLLDTAFAFRDRPKKPAETPGPWQTPKDPRKSNEKD